MKTCISKNRIFSEGIVGISENSFFPAHESERESLWNSPHNITAIVSFETFMQVYPDVAKRFFDFPKAWVNESWLG